MFKHVTTWKELDFRSARLYDPRVMAAAFQQTPTYNMSARNRNILPKLRELMLQFSPFPSVLEIILMPVMSGR